MGKYIYRFVASDFDLNEQNFSKNSDKELTDGEIQEIIDSTMRVNKPRIAYCKCYEKEVLEI